MQTDIHQDAPEDKTGFISESQILQKIPVCRRTLHAWRRKNLIPYIKLPGTRRILYDFEAVRVALMRMSHGCVE
jgi:predicted site-specific integrase-resolvase